MNPIKYCYEKAASPQQGFYYSLRCLPLAKRNAVVAIHAFYKEIEEVVLNCEEPNIAMIKLAWWREELMKSSEGTATHPVISALRPIIAEYELEAADFVKIIENFMLNIENYLFESFEDVIIFLMNTAGVRESLVAKIVGIKISKDALYQYASLMELTKYLQNLRPYIQKGQIYFSKQELDKFGVSVESLAKYSTSPEIKTLLQFQAETLDRMYSQVAPEVKESRHFKIGCESAKALLTAIRSSGFQVLENFINLTPLRFWWLAQKS